MNWNFKLDLDFTPVIGGVAIGLYTKSITLGIAFGCLLWVLRK